MKSQFLSRDIVAPFNMVVMIVEEPPSAESLPALSGEETFRVDAAFPALLMFPAESIAIVMGSPRARGTSRCNIPVAVSAELAEWVERAEDISRRSAVKFHERGVPNRYTRRHRPQSAGRGWQLLSD